MREMPQANKPQVSGSKTPPRRPLGTEAELASRLRLLQALQTSLEPGVVLDRFWQQTQERLRLGGMAFKSSQNDDFLCGNRGLHQCQYQIAGEEGRLGELIFSRSKRFTEEEMAELEELIALLVYPLRNALQHQALARFSLRDPLTGLGNRAALDAALERELQLAQRHHQSLSLLMIDLDHFKQINDRHGHAVGDQVLKSVGSAIQQACRNSDMSFRFGGEEFVVLLSNTDARGAMVIAERLRLQVARLELSLAIRPTVSIGIGTCTSGACIQADQLFDRADHALYQAKKLGRNRTQGEELQTAAN